MKKSLVALLIITLTATQGFSQAFSFGPKAGLNISNYTGGNIQSDAMVGLHMGGLINFGIGKVFSIQPEVLFSTQGARIENQGITNDFKVNYVSVPVMLKLKTSGGLYIEAGPQASFKTGENIGDESINRFARDLDLALGGGIGYQSGIGLGIGARYLAGISKVGDFNAGSISPDFKNSLIQVSLFWAIPVVK